MQRPILMTLLLALCAAPACASPTAQTDSRTAAQQLATERAQIEALLRGYHGLPERARFEAAAEEPAKILRAIGADAAAGPMQTAALEALKWWPDDRTFALYGQTVAAGNRDGVRHRVLRYLVVFGERAVPLLGAGLTDPSVQIRRTAATALFEVPGRKADKVMAEAAVNESDPALRAELEAYASRRGSIR